MPKPTAFLLTALIASTAMAQTTLATLNNANNSGNAGNNVYLDLIVAQTITITDINFRAADAIGPGGTTSTGPGLMNVYLGPTTWVGNTANAGLWTNVSSTVPTIVNYNAGGTNPGVLTPGVLASPLTLGPGSYGVALESQAAVWNHGYTNGSGTNSIIASNAELTIRAGAATNVPFTNPTFNPRVANVEFVYTLGGTPIAVASTETYGTGCYAFNTSFHEIFPNPASVDVANTSIRFSFAGGQYIVAAGVAPFVAPGAGALPVVLTTGTEHVNLSTVLGAAMVPIVYPQAGAVALANDLIISTDGYIVPDTSLTAQPVDGSPTVGEFYNDGQRWAPHWKNMDPTQLGNMTVEDTGLSYVISWNGVGDPTGAGVTTNSTFQVEFFYAGATPGDVEYRYGAMSGNGGGTYPAIIGWTQGGGALQKAVDVSAVSLTTDPVDNAPLNMVLDARPLLGTSPNFQISGYDAATLAGARILSFSQLNPGFDLSPLGLPGCFQYVGTDSVGIVFLAPGQTNIPFIAGGIPNTPTLNGILVFGQAATFTAGFNPLGVITSNGLRILLGSL